MNGAQLAQQIKFELETVVWNVPGGGVVFGDDTVRIVAGEPTEEQLPGAYPCALVVLGSGTGDPWDSNIINQTITVICVAAVSGDAMGEKAVVGGNTDDLTQSYGRGSSEIAERARAAVRNLTGADGCSLLVGSVDVGTPKNLKGFQLVSEEFDVQAVCTSDAYYTAPVELSLAGSTWSWVGVDMCRGRFDFVEYDLVRKAGSVAPTDPSDGTSAGTVDNAENITVASVAGQTYCVFAVYNSRKNGLFEGASQPEPGSTLAT